MKYLQLLLLSLLVLVSSCCGAKKTIKSQSEPTKELAVVIEVPDVVETPKISELPQPPQETEMEETTLPLPPKPPKQIEESTFNHSRWNKLLQQFVSENGNVDYKKIRDDRFQLDIYIDILTHNMPTEEWSKNEKLAYWINAYNALTIDLIRRNYPLESIKDIKDPWDQRLWEFGDKWLNLNDIEHKILRKMDEPRIHFAIVCASESCPKLQNEAFTVDNLEAQLTNATKEFLVDTSKNELSQNNIKLSKIFKWFKKDFEQGGSLIDFLNQYSEVTISSSAKKSFKDYNWDLNE
ncbi:DUF547 domain-containing protein [uncultured Winogradskyella sp.]|uniref:DUF547 domain-containing protein n=1 Tax=uncultured Winogradskyella sp. TaxID=395353 RepID=UPI00260B80EB|nr:DUF547 domain-containing protein [uncultured Winogradskyella sp.]